MFPFFSALVTVECMHAGVCGSASQASAVLQLLGYGFSWWREYWSQGVPDMETGSQYLEHPVITNLISNRGVASAPHSYYKPRCVLECRLAGTQRAIGDYYEALIDNLYR